MPDAFAVMPAMTVTPIILTAALPSLTQVSPNTAAQGSGPLTVSVTGQGTHFVPGTTTASFGWTLGPAPLTVTSPTSASADVDVASHAAVGGHDISLITGAETVILFNGFTVTQPIVTNYRIHLNGFLVHHETYDDILNRDGQHDVVGPVAPLGLSRSCRRKSLFAADYAHEASGHGSGGKTWQGTGVRPMQDLQDRAVAEFELLTVSLVTDAELKTITCHK